MQNLSEYRYNFVGITIHIFYSFSFPHLLKVSNHGKKKLPTLNWGDHELFGVIIIERFLSSVTGKPYVSAI